MALVSEGRSTLNPDALPFIPASLRQVEDFSPEWWQLITTSTWYRDYWLSQHQDEDGFYDNAAYDFDESNIIDLLPDAFDLDAGESFNPLEVQFEDFVMSYETELENVLSPFPANGLEKDSVAMMNNLSFLKSPKAAMEPAKYVNPK